MGSALCANANVAAASSSVGPRIKHGTSGVHGSPTNTQPDTPVQFKHNKGKFTRRIKPKPRSLLMNTSLIFPYFTNMFLNSSSGRSSGRFPMKRRERWVNVFSPGFRKLVISKVISARPSSSPSPAPPAGPAAGGCGGGGAGLSLFAGACAGDSVPLLGGWGELLLCAGACCIFRFAIL